MKINKHWHKPLFIYFLANLNDLTPKFEAVVFDVTVKVAVHSTPGERLEIVTVNGYNELE